jgi:capsular polysaccharide biosynthesis protein
MMLQKKPFLLKALALLAILGLAFAGYYWNLFQPVYTATALIKIHHETDMLDQVSYESDYQKIQSPNVLLPVIQKLKLDRIWAKELNSGQNALSPMEAVARMQRSLKFSVVNFELTNGTTIAAADLYKKDASGYSQYDANDIDYYVLAVTAQGETPQQAADIANAVVDSYKAWEGKNRKILVTIQSRAVPPPTWRFTFDILNQLR